ncbi:MAG: response regulator [Desulfamplus sp.]|nr:response regulator [Desulfamplus sp.]
MNKDYMVLIVDDEVQIGMVISNLLKKIPVASLYASNGKEALEIIKNSLKPFALIISDHRMPEMNGTEFFEKVTMIAPNSIRFMITGYANIHSMIDAVNRGEVHKYITKPWQNEDFLACVKEGLEQYELTMENIRLFNLAKEQNTKLVELNRMLSESAEKQARKLQELDARIAEESSRKNKTGEKSSREKHFGAEKNSRSEQDIDATVKRIRELLKKNGLLDYESMSMFYGIVLGELANRLQQKR